MQTNTAKFTGKTLGVDSEEQPEVIDRAQYGMLTNTLADFVQAHPVQSTAMYRYVKSHPRTASAIAAGLGATGMVMPVAAEINWTDIDAMFTGLSTHLIPDITSVISASTSLIITVVVIIVVIAVAMFFPELLYEILDMLKNSMRIRK